MTYDPPSLPPQTDITGVILAGGRGSRMGGKDKGLLLIQDRPLVAHLGSLLRPQTATLIISANRNLELYRGMGYPVVSDADDSYPGPLAGLLSALRTCKTRYLISAPCDTPLLPFNYVARMHACLQQAQAHACVARVDGYIQPVHILLERTLTDSLQAFMQRGERKVGDWIASLEPAIADFSDQAECFWNMNTPEDQQRITAYLETLDA